MKLPRDVDRLLAAYALGMLRTGHLTPRTLAGIDRAAGRDWRRFRRLPVTEATTDAVRRYDQWTARRMPLDPPAPAPRDIPGTANEPGPAELLRRPAATADAPVWWTGIRTIPARPLPDGTRLVPTRRPGRHRLLYAGPRLGSLPLVLPPESPHVGPIAAKLRRDPHGVVIVDVISPATYVARTPAQPGDWTGED